MKSKSRCYSPYGRGIGKRIDLPGYQRRAEREQLIRQITTRIRAAGDIQGVLEMTANELARSMGVSRSIVRLTTGDNV